MYIQYQTNMLINILTLQSPHLLFSEGGERKRKRKSRWGIVGPTPPVVPTVAPVPTPPVVAIVNGALVTLPPAVLVTI